MKKEMPVYHAQLTYLVSAVVRRVREKKEQTAPKETEGVKNDGKRSDSQKAD